MKENTRFFTPSFLNKMICFCLGIWVFGSFVHNCAAADFDNQRLCSYYPSVAKGHEEIYDRFLSGKLIYRPKLNSDEGKVELRIADLEDPLNGTFDLSRCGDTGNYLSISTGYRKGKKLENASKVEIWITPRFLIEEELKTTAKHFERTFSNWESSLEVGLFWTWGNWDDNDESMYYLTNSTMDDLSERDLYIYWRVSIDVAQNVSDDDLLYLKSVGYNFEHFHVSFMKCTKEEAAENKYESEHQTARRIIDEHYGRLVTLENQTRELEGQLKMAQNQIMSLVNNNAAACKVIKKMKEDDFYTEPFPCGADNGYLDFDYHDVIRGLCSGRNKGDVSSWIIGAVRSHKFSSLKSLEKLENLLSQTGEYLNSPVSQLPSFADHDQNYFSE